MGDCKQSIYDKTTQLGSQRSCPLPSHQSLLRPGGEELPDFETFGELGISGPTTLDMAERIPRPIRLVCKTEDNRAFWLDTDEWDTIKDLRALLLKRDPTHPEDGLSCFFYAGEELADDERVLGSYGVEPMGTLFLGQRLLGERLAALSPLSECVPQPSFALSAY